MMQTYMLFVGFRRRRRRRRDLVSLIQWTQTSIHHHDYKNIMQLVCVYNKWSLDYDITM